MTAEDQKRLTEDPDGLLSYEYIANHIEEATDEDIAAAARNIMRADLYGQFTASAARYLHAIDPAKYAALIAALTAATIDKDRERRYLGDLAVSLYGADYAAHAAELSATDDNFRRIYKRLFPNPESL